MGEFDLIIMGAIAGMIAIANPNLSSIKLDTTQTQNRRPVASRIQSDEQFNTPEHVKYKGVRWGNSSNRGDLSAGTLPANILITGDSPELEAQLSAEFASLPQVLQQATQAISIRQECHPKGCDRVAATAEGGKGIIKIWRDGQGYFPLLAHESAHLLAYKKWGTYTPPGYEELWQAEGGVSDYGSTSPTEDFAEAVQQYTEGRLQSESKRAFVQKTLNE